MKSTHILRDGEELEDGAALGENLRTGVSVDQHGLEDVRQDGGDLDQALAGGVHTGNVDQNVQCGGDNLQYMKILRTQLTLTVITSLWGSDLLQRDIRETN